VNRTPPLDQSDDFRAAVSASLLVTLALGVVLVVAGHDAHAIEARERVSYRGGWDYVLGRQGDDTVSPWLRTDAGIVDACDAYSGGYAQLDGFPDGQAFLAGCRDAARSTTLEPVPS
jgi:hypothetical protein